MPLKIIQWNIRNAIRNKASLSSLSSFIKPNIICLQETWSRLGSNLNIPGFNLMAHTPRPQIRGGGVAILGS